MKIIAVGMNYALHNKELGHTHENKEPVIFLKPDSAILKDGKPFFIPDFSNEVHYETEVVVRICRLGKNIAPRFAHRYYDAVTVGIDFTARDLQRKFREAGNPWELCKGFDNSAAIGTFVPLEQVGGNELQQVLDLGGVDRIMFDNFTPAMTKKAVEMVGGRYETESSGGITFDTLRDYAECGVDFISVGALTHSVKGLDMSFKAC